MNRKFSLGLSAAMAAGLAISPASAQGQSHGAGVSWSGMHGGVSWDGGHAYGGGNYSGYPATSSPPPVYKIPQSSPYRTEFSIVELERRRELRSVQRDVARAAPDGPDRPLRRR